MKILNKDFFRFKEENAHLSEYDYYEKWCDFLLETLLEDEHCWENFDYYVSSFQKKFPDDLQSIALAKILYWLLLLENEKSFLIYLLNHPIFAQMGQSSFMCPLAGQCSRPK